MNRGRDFTQIYKDHKADVFRAAASVLRDAALAEDVAQEVFLALWSGGGYDHTRGPVGPYLRLVARSRALDVWRSTRTRERAMARLQDSARLHSAVAEDPSDVVVRATDRERTRRGVRSLAADQRQAIGLTYWVGLTAQQVADVQDVPIGTAKSRVRLALRKLAVEPAMATA
jgi:RNA polymerase sigma-70 factor (ECF subfamily)